MKNSLYRLSFPSYLPVLEESDQQVVWSEKKFEEEIILLRLRDFDLEKGNLSVEGRGFGEHKRMMSGTAMATPIAARATATAVAVEHNENWCRAKKEFEETGKIKGHLFLTPCLQKIWLSHYVVKYLDNFS